MKLSDFDKIVCTAVDKRKSEWPIIDEEVRSRGGTVDFFVVGDGNILPRDEYDFINEAVPSTFCGDGRHYNFFRSFQHNIHKGYAAGLRNILFLEDDAKFLPEFDTVLAAAGRQLDELGLSDKWDLLYLGANHTWSATYEISPNLLRLAGSFCTHALLVSERIFPTILTLQPTHAIDLVFARMLHSTHKCFAVWPNIVIQKAGRSVIEDKPCDHEHYFACKGNPHYSLHHTH